MDIHEVKDLHAFKDNAIYEAKPLRMHVRMIHEFILNHWRHYSDLCSQLDEHDTMLLIEK
jgi:hypothetical protein